MPCLRFFSKDDLAIKRRLHYKERQSFKIRHLFDPFPQTFPHPGNVAFSFIFILINQLILGNGIGDYPTHPLCHFLTGSGASREKSDRYPESSENCGKELSLADLLPVDQDLGNPAGEGMGEKTGPIPAGSMEPDEQGEISSVQLPISEGRAGIIPGDQFRPPVQVSC